MSVWALFLRLSAFGLVSLIGLTLDTGLFLILRATGVDPFIANFISASLGVTFVYFASVRRIFAYEGGWLLHLFLLYLGYQVVAVALASTAVAWLVAQGLAGVLAKIAILPVTFFANYLFMRLLTRKISITRDAG